MTPESLTELVQKFERIIYGALIAMLVVLLVFAIAELAWNLFQNLTNVPPLLLENHELVSILGVFLLVLIGVELLDTMLAYFRENTIHVEIVVLLALIAISRKVILLDPTATDPLELFGIGVIVVGLAAAYFLIKRAGMVIGGSVGK
jgi:uncharacterized membrane protein (DUF373 family)